MPALPGFLPARDLSPALLSAGAWTTCPEGVTLSLSQPPYSYSCPFFLSSNKSLVPAAPQEPSITSWAPARQAKLQAVPLQCCSLLQSWLSPPAAPTSHPPGGCSELCREPAAQLSCATSTNHHRSTLAPREGKTKSIHPPPLGSPFSSTVDCRGKPALSRFCQLGQFLSTDHIEYANSASQHLVPTSALGPATHDKDAHSRNVAMCLPYSHHPWGMPVASQGVSSHALS